MSSSATAMGRGKAVQGVGDDVEETLEEIEGFDDFTIASTWERFISEIEAVCRLWLLDGHKNLLDKGAESSGSRRNLYRIKCELKQGVKLYTMEYYFHIHNKDKAGQWDDDLHSLQISFGVAEFLVIAPLSASGVVLDTPESSKLLSAVAIALSNCGSNWPAFVPVHDPSRKAYIGIQNMGTTFTRRFDSDRIGSQVPVRLLHLEGLYELFISKFALIPVDFSTNCFSVRSTMRLTYKTPPYADDDAEGQDHINKERKGDAIGHNYIKKQWDDDCPWAEWYSSEDPIKGFELTAIWPNKMFEGSVGMAELENESPFDAEKWLLLPIISQNIIDDSIGKFGFSSQLSFLVSALDKSFEAKYLEDFVSDENLGSDISKASDSIPPPAVVDRILKELFHDGVESSNRIEVQSRNSRFIKGAPLGSLFAQFCLHLLWLGNCNIRAIATLWIEFVREVRWCWEESEPLPKMLASPTIDLAACLVHQKLQMLAICIEKKNLLVHEHQSGVESEDMTSSVKKVDLHHNLLPKDSLDDSSSLRLVVRHDSEQSLACSSTPQGHETRSGDLPPTNDRRKGSASVVESMMLLNSFQNMHSPIIQDAPPMTEDMHEERLRAAEALGNLLSFSGQLERDILSSDMSAFKAANPDAVFEDFIRWHSAADWESDEAEDKKPNWPPKGRLSRRMAEHGSSWRQIWSSSPAMPSSQQRPLLDPIREGEKILHYLETLKPHQLLEQMVCTAFGASADTLSQTEFGDLRLMKTKIDQLYRTLASTLKPLLVNHVLDRVELIGDLKQLCVVFEHVEKLVILAASIRRKLSDAPRLSEATFRDYFDFYQPKMGTGSTSLRYDEDFNMKQVVKMHERDVIASFFPPPTASQSWRKVLSMGNLLFGHEPTLREIIFSVHDNASNGHYSGGDAAASTGDIETHRMYTRGTSNDLRVALSVTSWD